MNQKIRILSEDKKRMDQMKPTKSGSYVIKAGIPYQDAPPELQLQYAVNMGIGEVLVKNGFLIFVGAGIVRLLFKLVLKKRQRK